MMDEPRRYRMSLARQLSLLTGAVVAFSLLIVLAVAYEALTRSALSGAFTALTRATAQLANLAETSSRQTRTRFAAAAKDSAIRRALIAASASTGVSLAASRTGDNTVEAARKALSQLSTPTDSGMPIELWSASGRRVTYIG
ncbi:MAG TPA: hypothetical protein VJN70_15445, partial [Gemmatimonadaceae bacterium]|nr:hypothetical protein [Gemmatimonadaceae bacterium]